MREKIVKVYEFLELNEKAKEKAMEWYRNVDDYPWEQENRKTLERFCDIFPVRVDNWEYGAYRSPSADITFTNDDVSDLSGARLFKYIQNNYDKKYWSKEAKNGSCPLTGHGIDGYILDPLVDFMKKPSEKTFSELMNDCIYSWLKACNDDVEFRNSDEQVIESIIANEYEFLENGKRA